MYTTLMLNVDELWLKGKNRKLYFKLMRQNVKDLIKAYHEDKFTIVNEQQRLVVNSGTPFSEELMNALERVPGLHSFSPVKSIECNKEAILPAVKEELEALGDSVKTFKVQCKRVSKQFPTPSMELNRYIAGFVLKNFDNLKVDVHNPDVMIHVKVLNDKILVASSKRMCTGGLPVGSSGKLVTMISGGFDSPVASYMMSKRGCKQTFIFFYAYPYVGDEVKEKIKSICQVLGTYQNYCRLYVVPFGDVQNEISKRCKEDYRTLLFRKYMIDIAHKLCYKTRSHAILTGDALGQVSSQTMENMQALDGSVNRLIMRPLVGFNKIEIIEKAKIVGTHDISIIPHDDACSLFAPKHPVIRPHMEYWKSFLEENQDVDPLLNQALDDSEVYEISVKGEINQIK